MANKTKEFRQQIADAFIKSLQEDPLNWKKEWHDINCIPVNAVKNRPYKGINRFWLNYVARYQGWDDPRWCTFNNIKENGWHLTAGSKGTKVEYWSPYDTKEKKRITWDAYRADAEKDKYSFRPIYYTVFNGCQIEGIPELPVQTSQEIHPAEVIEKISSSMGVPITNDGGDRAYYSSLSDSIHLPKPEVFESDYAYNATALHELAHSTGHASRLNRPLASGFGTPEYAFEELIAEISSCFMSAELPVEQTKEHMDNHKAYVQSWIKEISDKPESLMKAIKEAERAANVLQFHGGLIEEAEYKRAMESSIEITENHIQSAKQKTTPIRRSQKRPVTKNKEQEIEK